MRIAKIAILLAVASSLASTVPARAQVLDLMGLLVGLDGKCLDVFEFGTDDGTPVVLYECNGGANQEWALQTTFGARELKGLGGKCLQPGEIGSSGLPEAVMGPCGTSAASWLLSPFSQDFTIEHVDTGQCLDVLDNMTADGTPIVLFPCSGQANQLWSFTTVPNRLDLPTLVLPHFDLGPNLGRDSTTLFSVRNSQGPSDLRYDYFDEFGNLVVSEVQQLAGQAIRSVNLRDIDGLPSSGWVGITVLDTGSSDISRFQIIHGDWFSVDTANDFAGGDRLLATLDPEAGASLCKTWEVRLLQGGAFDGGTQFTFFVPGNQPNGLAVVRGKVYDESGNLTQQLVLRDNRRSFRFDASELGIAGTSGSVEWQFSVEPGYVHASFSAEGRFSVGLQASCRRR